MKHVSSNENSKPFGTIQIRIMVFALPFFVVICCILVTAGYVQNSVNYDKTLAMADTYYDAGDFDRAVKEYKKVIDQSNKDQEEILIRMVRSYIVLENYDDAIQLMESYDSYEHNDETGEMTVLYNIVFELKVEQIYQRCMTKGDRYYENGEYNKAIIEYEEAARQKPTDISAFRKLMMSYINKGNLTEATAMLDQYGKNYEAEEIVVFESILETAKVDKQYNGLLEQAQELFHQEKFEESINMFEEAIELCPTDIEGYKQIADTYISLRRYEEALEFLKMKFSKYQINELYQLIMECEHSYETDSVRFTLLNNIYEALSNEEIDTLIELLLSSEYGDYIGQQKTVHYSLDQKTGLETMPIRKGMIIYSSGYIYCGDFSNGNREGAGRYFAMTEDSLGYVLYTGKWSANMPNGDGELITVMKLSKNQYSEYKVIVDGIFKDGYENGDMTRLLYDNNTLYGTLNYVAIEGRPQPMTYDMEIVEEEASSTYVIGVLEHGNTEEDYYYTNDNKKNTLWGIPGI